MTHQELHTRLNIGLEDYALKLKEHLAAVEKLLRSAHLDMRQLEILDGVLGDVIRDSQQTNKKVVALQIITLERNISCDSKPSM